MTELTTTLETLNTLRTNAGMKPLKAWKESKAKLAEKIAFLVAEGFDTPTTQEEVVEVKKGPTVAAKGAYKNERTAKARTGVGTKAPKEKPTRQKKAKTTARAKDGFNAAAIIKEFGLEPKQTRALLRRHNIERTEAAIRKFLKDRA